jgi:hypothetical protein
MAEQLVEITNSNMANSNMNMFDGTTNIHPGQGPVAAPAHEAGYGPV